MLDLIGLTIIKISFIGANLMNNELFNKPKSLNFYLSATLGASIILLALGFILMVNNPKDVQLSTPNHIAEDMKNLK